MTRPGWDTGVGVLRVLRALVGWAAALTLLWEPPILDAVGIDGPTAQPWIVVGSVVALLAAWFVVDALMRERRDHNVRLARVLDLGRSPLGDPR